MSISGAEAEAKIVDSPVEEYSFPLTYAQSRLWFLQQFDPESTAYLVPWFLRIRGPLDPEILRRALNGLLERHESLRTRFKLNGTHAQQVVISNATLPVPFEDISDLPDPLGEAERLSEEEGQKPLDIGTAPVFRAKLLKLDDDDHVLLLTTHHIVLDGASRAPFGNDLAAIYDALATGETPRLPELAIQYADYAVWERDEFSGQKLANYVEFWRKTLAGAPALLELPSDRPRPPVETFRGANLYVAFPESLSSRLIAFSKAQKATLLNTMLTGFNALLARYTGQADIVVGVPIANRNRVEMEPLIGFFTNTLVLRTQFDLETSFIDLLGRVRATAVDALTHSELPFEKLVEELNPERSLSHNPIFQVMLSVRHDVMESIEFPRSGLALEFIARGGETGKFDLSFYIREREGALTARVEYNTDLFDQSSVERIVGHFESLLNAAMDDPASPVSRLPLLTPPEVLQLEAWNATQHSIPRDRTLHSFVEEQAVRTPDAVAVRAEAGVLTYRELDERANQLAHSLLRQGVRPETLIGVCAERSLEMVVALLGVMKAGAVYVPIDPDFPAARIAAVLEDTATPFILTQVHLLPVLPPGTTPMLCLDRDWAQVAAEERVPVDVHVSGENLAYAIYTSGSTGKPKGVPNRHTGIVNRLLWMQAEYGLVSSDHVLQKTPYSFDVSVWEFFWPLMQGATLVMARPDGHKDPDYLVDTIRKRGITTLHFVPSMLRVFLESPGVEQCTSLLRVICSGEALPHDLTLRFFERLPGVELHNLYGPTEAAVDVTYFRCKPNAERSIVPIGRPVWNTQIHILDAIGQRVPIGVSGELHIAGIQLARGYLNRPELTAEKFIADPFSSVHGATMYRSGDLCRWLADGNIEYLGRLDNQVKLRGFRIELGEIESTLDTHPGILQSVVMAREDAPGDKRLVAYVVADPEYRPLASESLGESQVDQWSAAFDETYSSGSRPEDASFNIVGWNSSYDGKPIAPEEMRLWADSTASRILGTKPQRVWEIGCGTGLLLFRIAQHTEEYFATDLSGAAIELLKRELARPELELPQISLTQCAAHEVAQHLRPGQLFDAIVLNSVAQYFPSIGYLVEVIEEARKHLSPEGTIFLGDIRSFAWLEAFHTSVELWKAEDALETQQLWRRVQKQVRQDSELTLDPEFFTIFLPSQIEGLSRVEIQLKAGRAGNEVTRFRYDVMLHFTTSKPELREARWTDWQAQHLTADALRMMLITGQTPVLGVANVPSARVARDVAAWRLLAFSEAAANVADFREQIVGAVPVCAEPEDLWTIAEECGYTAEVRPSRETAQGTFDVVFRRAADAAYSVPPPGSPLRSRAIKTYANDPLRAEMERRLIPELHGYVAERLPEYMVPAAFVLLAEMPLGNSGKVDRKALPAPDQSVALLQSEYVAPQGDLERGLAEIWADLLRVEKIGTRDNFFEAGGHSLLATQVVSRMRKAFDVEVPLKVIFEDPTIAALARRIVELQREGRVAAFPLERVARTGHLPTSYAQQRLWFLDQLEPGQSVYNVSTVLRLQGAIDAERLERAINAVIARHEALRTTFAATSDGDPIEVIYPKLTVPLTQVDFNGDETAARAWVGDEAERPFDLASGPLLRASLVQLGSDDHVLEIIMHHIVSDGWSQGVLWREIKAGYEGVALPEIEIQYADYAAWQQRYLDGGVLEDQLAYWRQKLAGAPAALELPLDFSRPAMQTARGARLVRILPKPMLDALKQLCHAEGVTLFMAVTAAWNVLLARYTGHDDVVIGTPIAGRQRAELEPLIGFFVNTLVVRTDLSGRPTFRQLMQRVRETMLSAYGNQDVPFEKMVEDLNPVRDMSRSPLVQVLIALHNTEQTIGTRLGGVTVSQYGSGRTGAKFDLSVNMSEQPDGLRCALDYNVDLFLPATIDSMLGCFETLLVNILAEPSAVVSSIPLVSPSERDWLLHGLNDTTVLNPSSSLQWLIEQQVESTPEAPAVRFDGVEISFRELDKRANQLARYLVARDIAKGTLVGVCAERSIEMVVALVGILKAGCAYVPIDPEYPMARLESVLEDTATPLLLTQEHLLGILPESAPPTFCLDRDWKTVATFPTTSPDIPVADDNIAYVIYTSGSTGKPKGVPNTQAGIVNRLRWMQHEYGLAPSDRVLQKTPYSFDVSVWEFFWPLIEGACLVMAQPQGHKDPDYLVRTIADEHITTMHFVPSMLRVFLEAPQVESCRSLKRVMCSGEALPRDVVMRFFERLPRVELHNLYGPTEAAVDVTYFRCLPILKSISIPIGKPVWNTQIHILTPEGQLQPVGVPGELHIAGVQLAKGYLNRPELTTERFVANPFSSDKSARMYKTGDLCRWLPDGNIEYMGRLDHQVKVRGFRIELGEIEAALRGNAGVDECVVIAREDEPGDKRLVAYLVAEPAALLNTGELRPFLAKTLPEYMVPSAFVVLDALPLSSNGKLDRKALPKPEYVSPLNEGGREPETEVEQMVAAIWCDVLKLDRVSLDDDFFQLGGHSLLATRVVSRVREAFHVDLPLRDLFENATVGGLSSRVYTLLRSGQLSSMPPLVPVSRDRTLPLSFAQQRMWFIDELEPGAIRYNIPKLVRLRGALDTAALQRALDEVVTRHEVLRTSFSVDADQPVQIISPQLDIPINPIDLTHLEPAARDIEWQRFAETEAQQPFNLATGPLLRAFLLRLTPEDHVLVLTMHHIVTERWSQGLLWGELSTLYGALTRGLPSPLAPLPVQYADFAVWQREWLKGDELERQVSYWRDRLAGAPPFLELPTDFQRPAVQQHRGGTLRRELSADLVAQLAAFCKVENATLYMTMLAAFKVLLMRYTGQTDMVVGTVIAGRTHAEIERLIGFFVNTLVLRTDLSGDPTFREVVARVRETTLGAYTHQDIPFEKLVEELNPERSLNRNPFFQVAFIHDQSIRKLELSGLNVESLQLHQGTSVFDLTWYIVEHNDGVRIFVEYDVELFEAATIDRMLDHYCIVLDGAMNDPRASALELPLLSAHERNLLLYGLNNIEANYPAGTIAEHIARQAEARPNSVALKFGTEVMTYGELDRRSNQFSRHLRSVGVVDGILVAVCMERGFDVVTALLGIWKAGAVYVPLDPAYPAERLAMMLEDGTVRWVVGHDATRTKLPVDAHPIMIDDSRPLWEALPDQPPTMSAQSGDLAYVIHTSGSTGRPKGAMVHHDGAANCLHWMQQTYKLNSDDKFLFKTSLNFDPSVWEIFWTLMTGAQVVIAPPEAYTDVQRLIDLIVDERVTYCYLVPSLLAAVLDFPSSEKLATALQCVISGGEKLSPQTIALFQQRLPGVRLHHSYGPTETSIAAAEWACVDKYQYGVTPIGKPIANTSLYVLDPLMEPVPRGVSGELYIGGAGVGLGYLNRPDLTAERFLPNPFLASGRLYKTGDKVRYLPDGNLQFLGRLDNQVKIRGFRIELGEIEAALHRHPAVTDCLVLAREDSPGEPRLAAYVVMARDLATQAEAIRAHLEATLPEYMVPPAIILLDAMPLQPNGKVDRRALPVASFTASLDPEARAPESAVQQMIAALWCDVLRLDSVALEDDFFHLGGHSLLATQLLSRIRTTMNVELSLRTIFEGRTLASLAARVEEARGGPPPIRPPLTRISRDRRLPLSFAQQRMWLVQQMDPERTTYSMPSTMRLTGVLDIPALEFGLNEIVRRHEVLRTVYPTFDDEPYQLILPHHPFDLLVVDVEADTADPVSVIQSLSAEEASIPFDLATGPMFRFKLLRLTPTDHALVTVLHHINTDGWSSGVLARELATHYAAALEGHEAPLPDLAIQYADYAVWQRNFLSGETLARQLAFWRGALSGAPDLLPLPTDRAHPVDADSDAWAAFHLDELPADLAAGVAEFAHRHAATPFMVLASAYYWLLARLSGQRDIVIGTDLANRTTLETERLIGFFVNVLPVRARMSSDQTFAEFVRDTRESMLDAFTYQEMPFDKLVQELQPERSKSHNPLVQVLFVMQNAPRNELQLPGLTASNVRSQFKARFDLSLFLTPGETLRASWMYNTALFDPATIERFASLYRELVTTALANPEITFEAALEELNATERASMERAQLELKGSSAGKLKTMRRRAAVDA